MNFTGRFKCDILVPRVHMVYGTYTCPTCTRGIGYLYLSHVYTWYIYQV